MIEQALKASTNRFTKGGHFLLISSIIGPTIGGIETLIGRMSIWLLKRGYRVTILANTAEGYRELFPDGAHICELGDQLKQLGSYYKARKIWPQLSIERPDIIKSFHLEDSWISSVLSSLIEPTPRVIYGNYFPHSFPTSRSPFSHLTNRFYLHNLKCNFDDRSILCMDNEQISQFRRLYGSHRDPVFWPLPIAMPAGAIGRVPKWGKIVSVSRLEPMKEYNLYMIDAIARLRDKGYPVTWTVYGEGCLASEMQARIYSLGLKDYIKMMGKLAYHEFASALKDAYIFVGGGTSIVEAAMCGVPGVTALAFDATGSTYGPLYKFPFGNLGLRTEKEPTFCIENEVERILNMGKDDYREEERRNLEYAHQYSMENLMEMFIGIALKSAPPKTSCGWFLSFYPYRNIERFWIKVKPFLFKWIHDNEDL